MKNGIFLSQAKYGKEMLKKFNMEDCKPVSTPMMTSCKLSKDDYSPTVDHKMYRSMVGSLLYLIASGPDILQAMKGFELIAYSNADWVGCVDDRKSTNGVAFYLRESLVTWHSKKQDSISLSTAEAEYMAATSCCTQILWMIQMLKVLHVEQALPVTIY
ncbi:uncharacterized mitochondrial protein AtMg00810-like [Telopea speciosissima]|uniref:uncharacterized mitochondrial protein AtMg00810-like n=1 Tax=Telopea speciosissima TaxID=54955 RepID=UPI001CC3D945|nr:uncharacterized mitochondrial protein AtMg00810-like [Telopea speciosissima]